MSGAQDLENHSTLTVQQRDSADDSTVATAVARANLTFHFDPESKTYTLTSNGQTVSFAEADAVEPNTEGDAEYRKDDSGKSQYLTLFNPDRLGSGTKYVSGGLWQRLTQNDTGDNFEFDIFVYGFPTIASSVPTRGTGSYDIDLFGVVSPHGIMPHTVIGDGIFSVDFLQGLFAMSGRAGEYNTDVDYWTCCSDWRGAGYIGSGGLLTGNFSYDGRDRRDYQATIEGGFFGPNAQEVGGTLLGSDSSGATFTGIFVGTEEGTLLTDPLSALSEGARTYASFRGNQTWIQRAGNDYSEAGAQYWPNAFGAVQFGADGSFTLVTGIYFPEYEDVTFTSADRIRRESDNRFAVYQVDNNIGTYRLELFQPGPDNPEVELTYSSFGKWQETRVSELSRGVLSSWFVYGVPTASKSLPLSGTGHYQTSILGSGERYASAERLILSGQGSIDIDFGAMAIDGVFDADARTEAGEFIDLLPMTFGGELFNTYGFYSFLLGAPGIADGSIQGRLYGPSGEEVGGTFEFYTKTEFGGAIDAGYAGVIYGTRD